MNAGFFLPLYQGESFYSGIARHGIHASLNPWQIASLYFDRYTQPVHQRLPFDLAKFTKKIVNISLLTADEIIQNHSLFKIYSSFMNSDNASLLYSFMLNTRGSVQAHVKIDTDTTKFSYCWQCAEEDTSINGESFWRSVHSIPFIQVCPKHDYILSTWKVPPEKVNPRNYFASDIRNFGEKKTNVSPSSVLSDASKMFDTIQSGTLKPDLLSFVEKAKKKGFYIEKKNSYSLNQSLLKKYEIFLEKEKVDFGSVIKVRPVIVNKVFNGSFHPYNPHNFIFLTQFFNALPDAEFRNDYKTVTCHNRFCNFFQQPITKENYEVIRVGTIKELGARCKCPVCGYTFRMSLEPKSTYFVIENYGKLIQKIVRSKVKDGLSFRELEKRLAINRKHLAKIHFNSVQNIQGRNEVEFIKLRNQRRAAWKDELTSSGFVSIYESKKKLKTEYRWLLKKDSTWMLKINNRFRRRTSGRKSVQLNKNEIKAFKKKLTQIKEELLNNRIVRQISMALFCSHLTKNERTIIATHLEIKKHGESLTENDFDFKLRRIDYFLRENPMLVFTKSFLFSKFKISHSIGGNKKEQLQMRLRHLEI